MDEEIRLRKPVRYDAWNKLSICGADGGKVCSSVLLLDLNPAEFMEIIQK